MQFIFALARPTIATRASRRLAGHVVATFKSLQAVLQMNKRETLLTDISKGRSKKRVLGLSPKRGGVIFLILLTQFSKSFLSQQLQINIGPKITDRLKFSRLVLSSILASCFC